jgi:hypothetical protein
MWGFVQAASRRSAPLKCISEVHAELPSIGVIIIYAVDEDQTRF